MRASQATGVTRCVVLVASERWPNLSSSGFLLYGFDLCQNGCHLTAAPGFWHHGYLCQSPPFNLLHLPGEQRCPQTLVHAYKKTHRVAVVMISLQNSSVNERHSCVRRFMACVGYSSGRVTSAPDLCL